jgi:hypothetical protein
MLQMYRIQIRRDKRLCHTTASATHRTSDKVQGPHITGYRRIEADSHNFDTVSVASRSRSARNASLGRHLDLLG